MAAAPSSGFTEPKNKDVLETWFKKRTPFHWAPVSNGMGVHGLPDRMGCVPLVVTQEMVGKTIGVFVGIEVKADGRQGEKRGGCTPQQVLRGMELRSASGVHSVVYCPDDIRELDALVLAKGGRLERLAGRS